MSATTTGCTLVTHVATLDVPRHVVDHLSRLLAAHRRRIGIPRGSRALGPFRQAVLVLCWFCERGCVHCLKPGELRPMHDSELSELGICGIKVPPVRAGSGLLTCALTVHRSFDA